MWFSKAVPWVFNMIIQFRNWNDPKHFSVNWNSRINPDKMTTRNFFILRNWNWKNSVFNSINKKNFWISFHKSEKMQIPSQKRTNFRVPIRKPDIFHSTWRKLNDWGLQNCNLFPPRSDPTRVAYKDKNHVISTSYIFLWICVVILKNSCFYNT